MRISLWAHRTTIGVAAVITAAFDVQAAFAQSLGDVARREEARRKQVTSGRVYTNEDLGTVETPASTQPPAAPPPTETAPAQEAARPEPRRNEAGFIVEEDKATGTVNMNTGPGRPKRDEQYWRARARDLQERLARVHTNIAAAKTRLAELDAGAQTPQTARERQTVATRLQQLQSELPMRNQDLAQLRTLAESAKIPLEWIQ